MTEKMKCGIIALLIALLAASGALAVDVDTINLYGPDSMIAGRTVRLEAVVNPQNAYDQRLTWESSDTGVATVSENGAVTAKDVGGISSVVITATAQSGAKGQKRITVNPRAVSIVVTPSSANFNLSNEGYLQFECSVYPQSACQDVVWSVNNKRIAAITDDGLFTAKKPGTVTVKARVSGQESVMASARIEIVKTISSVSIKGAARLMSGKKTKLYAVTVPKAVKKNPIIWECLNPEYAKVSVSGKVTAFEVTEEHTVTIRATAKNNPAAIATHEITIYPAG